MPIRYSAGVEMQPTRVWAAARGESAGAAQVAVNASMQVAVTRDDFRAADGCSRFVRAP
jgi:hypothetical protein